MDEVGGESSSTNSNSHNNDIDSNKEEDKIPYKMNFRSPWQRGKKKLSSSLLSPLDSSNNSDADGYKSPDCGGLEEENDGNLGRKRRRQPPPSEPSGRGKSIFVLGLGISVPGLTLLNPSLNGLSCRWRACVKIYSKLIT